ncbi:uncharacterized protein GGS25DRAFT_524728 [Hypoxylon fragiforme]|uniref:uncharacterized protein n=1 Tax=Hypoxylon fragiforme TaxID=63214 RepID=UPI0020C64128|nr:uncharacterized protein GGS25DRAFT_524728 [Hypoxylon fragiforme]KAI2605210.1 hypothetical protein GGS25DRAFT_524728 [Hypoxylon fragiforme]
MLNQVVLAALIPAIAAKPIAARAVAKGNVVEFNTTAMKAAALQNVAVTDASDMEGVPRVHARNQDGSSTVNHGQAPEPTVFITTPQVAGRQLPISSLSNQVASTIFGEVSSTVLSFASSMTRLIPSSIPTIPVEKRQTAPTGLASLPAALSARANANCDCIGFCTDPDTGDNVTAKQMKCITECADTCDGDHDDSSVGSKLGSSLGGSLGLRSAPPAAEKARVEAEKSKPKAAMSDEEEYESCMHKCSSHNCQNANMALDISQCGDTDCESSCAKYKKDAKAFKSGKPEEHRVHTKKPAQFSHDVPRDLPPVPAPRPEVAGFSSEDFEKCVRECKTHNCQHANIGFDVSQCGDTSCEDSCTALHGAQGGRIQFRDEHNLAARGLLAPLFPDVPVAPAAPKAPQAPARPATPQAPQAPARPAPPQAPQAPARPATPQAPKAPARPAAPAAPKAPARPATPQEPAAPARPAKAHPPAAPVVPRNAYPEAPVPVKAPAYPAAPAPPKEPAYPEKPAAPKAPAYPEAPAPPKAPAYPEAPAYPRTPEKPKTPEKPVVAYPMADPAPPKKAPAPEKPAPKKPEPKEPVPKKPEPKKPEPEKPVVAYPVADPAPPKKEEHHDEKDHDKKDHDEKDHDKKDHDKKDHDKKDHDKHHDKAARHAAPPPSFSAGHSSTTSYDACVSQCSTHNCQHANIAMDVSQCGDTSCLDACAHLRDTSSASLSTHAQPVPVTSPHDLHRAPGADAAGFDLLVPDAELATEGGERQSAEYDDCVRSCKTHNCQSADIGVDVSQCGDTSCESQCSHFRADGSAHVAATVPLGPRMSRDSAAVPAY